MTQTKTQAVDKKSSPRWWRHSDSIFIRCLYMLAISAALVIGLVTFKSMRATEMVANASVLKIGTEVTQQLAERNLAALQFRKADDIAEVLRSTVDGMTGSASGALVMAADGEVLAEAFYEGQSNTDLLATVEQAMNSGEMVVNADRLVIAVPMRIGADQRMIGVVGLDWSSEVLYKIAATQNRNSLLLAVGLGFFMLVIVGFMLRRMVARPLLAVAGAMKEVADGNYDVDIPKYRRGNEIGIVARGLEQFRDQLASSEVARRDAAMKSAALDAGSAAIMITDANFDIVYASSAVEDLLSAHQTALAARIDGFDLDSLIGQSMDAFHKETGMDRNMLEDLGDDAHDASLDTEDMTLALKVSRIDGEEGACIGYVVEWADVTEERLNSAVLKSLDDNQARAEFNAEGRLIDANLSFLSLAGLEDREASMGFAQTVFADDAPADPAAAAFSAFEIKRSDGTAAEVLGGLSPVLDSRGALKRTVLIGADVTEERRAKMASEAERQRLQSEQEAMIAALSEALSALAEGDLSVRIDQAFSGANDRIRNDFNLAVGGLEEAIGAVSQSTSTIRSEVSGVADATVSLSRRTEHQAATLQQTASALVQLSASVTSSADGAKNADDIVGTAQKEAKTSGKVVQDAVDAMGEIAESSSEITSIVKVIDDIAFQTNLLALNAGVEAARAGDAGRGFAVVASEVRALAQRSSEAANEISTLISASSQSVDLGVKLVGEAGEALKQIVASISDISGHVSQIAAASKEQSMGLNEISTAMSQLDQVTQENAAMFEETSAASQTLSNATNDLAQRVERFTTQSVDPVEHSEDTSDAFEDQKLAS